MPDPTPLTVTAPSASALAAARPGEVVTVRVAALFEVRIMAGVAPVLTHPDGEGSYLIWPNTKDEILRRFAPAAVGGRVAVKCVCWHCDGEGGHRWREHDGSEEGYIREERCEDCGGFGTLYWEATVTAAPEPEAWCECQDEPLHQLNETGTGWKSLVCPKCDGFPPWVWRVGVRRERTG